MQHAEKREGPVADRTLSRVITGGDTSILAPIVDNLTQLQRDVVVEAVLSAWGQTWERRARALEAARPVPGDFTGGATREELSARWRRLTEAAAACRARAQLCPQTLVESEFSAVLGEAA